MKMVPINFNWFILGGHTGAVIAKVPAGIPPTAGLRPSGAQT